MKLSYAFALLAALASPALAANAEKPSDHLAEVAAIRTVVEKSYIFPEKRAAITDKLQTALQTGRYHNTTPAVFSERVTEDVRAASGDHHLYLFYDREQSNVLAQDAKAEKTENTDAYERRHATSNHHGLTELRILPGNLRYLKIASFEWIDDETGGIYDDAMRFLKDGDGLIIDLRGNPGGSHAAVRYLVSHFMKADLPLYTFFEAGKAPVQSRTLSYLPAGRLIGKPLAVLIDGNVGSAGEDFAYQVQQYKLGVLIGNKTVGAANNNKYVPIPGGYVFSISFGRPVHPVSNSNWEGVGIAPDIESDPLLALDVAQIHLLDRLSQTASVTKENRADYAWVRVAVNARLHPVVLPMGTLQSWTGQYGPIAITATDGSLVMTRADRPARRLTPLAPDGLFAIEGNDMLRVRFLAHGLQTLWQDDPEPRNYDKTSH
jgi:hypothetical protein